MQAQTSATGRTEWIATEREHADVDVTSFFFLLPSTQRSAHGLYVHS